MEGNATNQLLEYQEEIPDESGLYTQHVAANSTVSNDTSAAIRHLNKSFADRLLPVSVTWGLVSTLGILGNLAVIILFLFDRRLKRRPLKFHSMSLAAVDLFSSVFIIPIEIYKHRNYFSDETNTMCKYKCFFNITTMACACFILVFIAINRYIVSSRPLSVYRRSKKSHIILKLFFALVIAIFISVPLPILCGSYGTTIRDLNGNKTFTQVCGPEQKYRFSSFRFVYKYFLSGLQLVLSIVLIVLYALIARKITLKWRKPSTGSITSDDSGELRQERSAGRLSLNIKVMFGVTVTFVVSYLIYAVLSFVDTADIPGDYFAAYAFVYRIYFINCVAMPIMYLKFDTKFRTSFVSLITCKRKEAVKEKNKSRLYSNSSCKNSTEYC